jgi:excisionase family DNA binding protein
MKLVTLTDKIRAAQWQSDELLTKQELASRIKLSIRSVDEWMRLGRIPYLKCGKAVRFRWSDIIAHLERFRVK